MGVVVYQCDTCKREIDTIRNERGMDTIKRCIITNKCKGSMYQVGERPTSVYGRPIDDVDGLDNYQQRNLLHIHNQLLSSSSWTINHNLNSDPAIVAYIDMVDSSGNKSHVEMNPNDYVVTYVDSNTTKVEFATNTTGLAHVISRSSNNKPIAVQNNLTTWHQLTANSIITIGVPTHLDTEHKREVQMKFISPSTSEVSTVNVLFTSHKHEGEIALFNTPWQDSDVVFVGGVLYKVKSARVNDIVSSNNIANKTPFYFDKNDQDFIIFSSNPPYSSSSLDVNMTTIFKPQGMSDNATDTNTKVSDSQLFIDETQGISYHPAIKIVERIF